MGLNIEGIEPKSRAQEPEIHTCLDEVPKAPYPLTHLPSTAKPKKAGYLFIIFLTRSNQALPFPFPTESTHFQLGSHKKYRPTHTHSALKKPPTKLRRSPWRSPRSAISLSSISLLPRIADNNTHSSLSAPILLQILLSPRHLQSATFRFTISELDLGIGDLVGEISV